MSSDSFRPFETALDPEAALALLREATVAEIQDLWPLNHFWSRLEEAEAHYRRAIELDPGADLAHGNLGVLLEGQGFPPPLLVQETQVLGVLAGILFLVLPLRGGGRDGEEAA